MPIGQNPTISQLDPGQIIKRVYDEANDQLRTSIDASINVNGQQTLVIDEKEDSIVVFGTEDGTFGGTHHAIKVASNGDVQVDVVSSALPNNAATATNQTTEITAINQVDADLVAFKNANHSDLITTQPRNITQFGSTNISTGTGTSGAGIPRVTVSNDSKVQIWDGTNQASVSSAGGLIVAGLTSVGSTPSNNPVSVSGVDGGGLKRALLTDILGRTEINNYSATPAITRVASSASSVQLLAANASRRAVYLFNESVATVYLKFGTTASITSYTTQIPSTTLLILNSDPIYTGRIDAIWTAANGAMQITELT